ncbi:MAG: hypothetical protein K2X62_15260 [Beijerinckiaceae bacterium]|jgi:hypothetical protein|nr:hypothetical protein [Beijerinckiaceae bacterium]
MSGHLKSAFDEGRGRVFGAGLDKGFLLLLALAVLIGGVALAWRHDVVDIAGVLVGVASMAIFVTMPFLAVTIFCTSVSLLAQWAGTPETEDPPMAAVLGACAISLAIVVAIVGGIAHIPLVGDQLRAMFI